jgi:hypothetical protein
MNTFVGTAEFSNGNKFTLYQKPKNKGFFIRDASTGKDSYATTYGKAWSSIAFKARIDYKTQNTTGWRG